MKRITFTCSDEQALKFLTGILPHLHGQTLIVDDVPSPTGKLPKLEAPPRPPWDGEITRPKTVKRLRGRPAAAKVQAEIKTLAGSLPQFTLADLYVAFKNAGSGTPKKTLSNNIQALKNKGDLETIGGSKNEGYVYRFKEVSHAKDDVQHRA